MASGRPHLEANMKKVKSIPAPGQYPNDDKRQPTGWIFPPGAFNIIWGADERYWKITDDSAELVQVSWLEVTGSTKDLRLEEGKTYEISFKVSLKQGAFAWDKCPVFMMAKLGKRGSLKWKKIAQLSDEQVKGNTIISTDKLRITVTGKEEDRTIYFGLYEIWSGKWKGGLIIHEARVELAENPSSNPQTLPGST